MQKVDLVIAIVGVAAVVATTLGVVLYDEFVGNEELSFDVVMEDAYFMDAKEGVGSGNHEFTFALPDNSTAASFEVTVTFQGQAGAGSNIAVSAYFTDPTGNRTTDDTGTLNIAQNEGPGDSVTLTLSRTWAEVPEGGNTTDPDAAAKEATLSWENKPLILVVTIGGANDALAGVLPQVNYTYDIDVSGDLTRFERAEREEPDPSTV